MVGEDQTNKPDLRATPETDSDAEAGQKDAPLPAFIYGRDGHGDGNGRGDLRSRDRQNFNARIADMDRKTLLGLVTGAGMLGLVLFFAGMLVGAGLFMDSEDTTVSMPTQKAPVEMLASEPDAPVVMTEPVPEPAAPVEEPKISADSDDPVGDLIAQRTEALSGQGETSSETASSDAAAMTETADANTSDTSSISAPEIRDVAKAADVPEAPDAPEVSDAAEAPAEQAEPAAEAEEPATAPTETAAKPGPPSEAEASTAESADKPFSVQIGAFKVHENASQRAEELRKKGLQVAVVVRGPENDAAWYYVRIGAYASLAAARDDAAKIKKDHAIDGFPVRAEPNDREVK